MLKNSARAIVPGQKDTYILKFKYKSIDKYKNTMFFLYNWQHSRNDHLRE